MTSKSDAGAIGATFSDKASAERCVADLRLAGFDAPWLAVVTDESGVSEHAVAETSDGAIGSLARYFTGRHLLRPLLLERGLAEREAASLDESVAPGGAVVVVQAHGAMARALEICGHDAARTAGGDRLQGARYPSTTATVAGQGAELDRGSGSGAGGGGRGAPGARRPGVDRRRVPRSFVEGGAGDVVERRGPLSSRRWGRTVRPSRSGRRCRRGRRGPG